jgi:hypothetical protein
MSRFTAVTGENLVLAGEASLKKIAYLRQKVGTKGQ